MEKNIILSIWVIAAFLSAHFGGDLVIEWGCITADWPRWVRLIIVYFLLPIGLPVTFLFASNGPSKIWAELGLSKGFLTAGRVGFLATLPMLLGYAWLGLVG